MAKHRRRSLAGSPAHHATQAHELAEKALEKYAASEEAAAILACDRAFGLFVGGAGYANGAALHDSEAGGALSARESQKVIERHYAAEKVLKAACLIDEKTLRRRREKLGGLRRRRVRRF